MPSSTSLKDADIAAGPIMADFQSNDNITVEQEVLLQPFLSLESPKPSIIRLEWYWTKLHL